MWEESHTMLPLTERYVPSATQQAPFRLYPPTKHCLNRFESPSQLSMGRLNLCMYFLSCDRIETARDNPRKDRECILHHPDDWPYLMNAL
jgi:hypothetical protein